jgi:hypothetical protein
MKNQATIWAEKNVITECVNGYSSEDFKQGANPENDGAKDVSEYGYLTSSYKFEDGSVIYRTPSNVFGVYSISID